MDFKSLLHRVIDRENLSAEEAEFACGQILKGEATPAQIAALIVALRMKGETVKEILGFARAMREAGTGIKHSHETVIDTCGTGGDAHGTFNVSTAAAFVTAAAGVPVAKHGNRAVSSKAGSADVLTALGVKVDCSVEVSQRCLDEAGICFLFAPYYHGAMKHAAGPRREIGARTIFNMIGPLTNPAGATQQVLGVYSQAIMEPLAEVLRELGSRHSLIVHSEDGLDEIAVTSATHVAEVTPERVIFYIIKPEEIGLQRYPFADLLGGDAEVNAKIITEVLEGRDATGRTAMVAANAGAGIFVGGKAATLKEGVAKATTILKSGAAMKTLEMLKTLSNS